MTRRDSEPRTSESRAKRRVVGGFIVAGAEGVVMDDSDEESHRLQQ